MVVVGSDLFYTTIYYDVPITLPAGPSALQLYIVVTSSATIAIQWDQGITGSDLVNFNTAYYSSSGIFLLVFDLHHMYQM